MAAARRAVAVAMLAAGAVLVPVPGAVGGPASEGVVLVTTTGDRSELRETVPISHRGRAKARVAMSLAPREIPGLIDGDRLRVSAELQTTNNCYRRSSYCVSRPYGYSPKIATRVVLARGGDVTGGPGAVPISKWRTRPCAQKPSAREHHCVRVFRGSGLEIEDASALPCEPKRCRINLVVAAHHRKARSGDVVILGIDRKDGRVLGDRGRLNATRLRGNVPRREHEADRRRHRAVTIRKGEKTSIYSMRLSNLRRHDQLTFDARASVGIGHLSYSTFVGSQLVLGKSPRATHTTRFTRRVGTLRGEVTEANGFNCTQRTTPCPVQKVGTLRIRKTPKRGDRRVPLFVNLVLRNAPKQVDAEPGDAMRVRAGGAISALRYPASARG